MVMETVKPKIKEASFIHQLFGVTPGYAPRWAKVCIGDCIGGLFGFVYVGFFAAVLAAGKAYGWWVLAVAAPVAIVWWVLIEEFANREQFGRARLRRNECVWCGQKGVASDSICPACRRKV